MVNYEEENARDDSGSFAHLLHLRFHHLQPTHRPPHCQCRAIVCMYKPNPIVPLSPAALRMCLLTRPVATAEELEVCVCVT